MVISVTSQNDIGLIDLNTTTVNTEINKSSTTSRYAIMFFEYVVNRHTHSSSSSSGTPIQNSVRDLWMLVAFLGLKPFDTREWWNRVIQRPVTQGDRAGLQWVLREPLTSRLQHRINPAEGAIHLRVAIIFLFKAYLLCLCLLTLILILFVFPTPCSLLHFLTFKVFLCLKKKLKAPGSNLLYREPRIQVFNQNHFARITFTLLWKIHDRPDHSFMLFSILLL